MIQRIQSIYLFLVVLLMGALPFIVSLWDVNGEPFFAVQSFLYAGLYVLSAILALIAIMLFSNRKLQFVLNRLNIILNFTLLGVLVYRLLNVSGEMQISEKGIGMFLPIISIVFLVLANKAIKKDENLVKSVDRLR